MNAENEPVIDIDDEADYRDFPVVSSEKKDDGASMYYPTTMSYDANANVMNTSGAVFSRGFVLPRPNLYDNNPYHQPFPRIQRN